MDGIEIASATLKNKKEAKKQCAENALKVIYADVKVSINIIAMPSSLIGICFAWLIYSVYILGCFVYAEIA